MNNVIGPLESIGELVAFEPRSLFHEGDKYSFKNLNLLAQRSRVAFAKDYAINYIVEKLCNVDVFDIALLDSTGKRIDQLFYFRVEGKLFLLKRCGLLVSFLPDLESIPSGKPVSDKALFVGSRNNFTHELLDFYPNRLFI